MEDTITLFTNTRLGVDDIDVLSHLGVRQIKPREVRWFQPLIAPAIFISGTSE